MSDPIFKSDRRDFTQKHESFIDMTLGRLAMYVEIALKVSAGMPVDTGNMKSQTRHFKSRNGKWRTEIDAAYAAYQERGMRADGTHKVTNYTTTDTGAGFFMRAIDIMLAQREQAIMESKRALNL